MSKSEILGLILTISVFYMIAFNTFVYFDINPLDKIKEMAKQASVQLEEKQEVHTGTVDGLRVRENVMTRPGLSHDQYIVYVDDKTYLVKREVSIKVYSLDRTLTVK